MVSLQLKEPMGLFNNFFKVTGFYLVEILPKPVS